MHFRQFLITALMVGAAIFFPDNAFAEKNELASQKGQAASSEKGNKDAVKINIPPKAEQANSAEKAVPEQATVPEKAVKAENTSVPEHARINQAEAKQLPPKVNPNHDTLKSMPEQAKGNGRSELNKAENTVRETGHERAAAVQTKQVFIDEPAPKSSLLTTDTEVKVEEAKQVITVEPQGEDPAITKSAPVEHVPEKVPTSNEEIPKQMVNQPQRSNQSGGQSHDRVIQGLNTINLLDKWFDWDYSFEMKLIQPYLSRLALMNTQWVNAPPAPPPQKAPLLINVTRC
ncbi:hypothetical protein J2Y03_005695 [Neobacillus niacini]|uniref:hypothetical protein n=1 Tax=Neobacillus niacini TaxID=86668 RepID=UPI002858BC38|nr:hypothetical protein [Neobacillus niacini]MDR7080608.1 hypothetical protein [Neobacillus niacini]